MTVAPTLLRFVDCRQVFLRLSSRESDTVIPDDLLGDHMA